MTTYIARLTRLSCSIYMLTPDKNNQIYSNWHATMWMLTLYIKHDPYQQFCLLKMSNW